MKQHHVFVIQQETTLLKSRTTITNVENVKQTKTMIQIQNNVPINQTMELTDSSFSLLWHSSSSSKYNWKDFILKFCFHSFYKGLSMIYFYGAKSKGSLTTSRRLLIQLSFVFEPTKVFLLFERVKNEVEFNIN